MNNCRGGLIMIIIRYRGNTMEIEGAVRRWRMSMTSLAGSGRGDAAFAGRKMDRLTEDAGP